MPEDELDPGANTQMFQAFMDRPEEPDAAGSRWMIPVLVVAALVIVVGLAWFVLG